MNTEEEKVRILDKVFLYGVSSTAVFVFLLGMYAYGLQNRSEWLGDVFLFLINMGGFFSLSTAFAGLRLRGKMSKERIGHGHLRHRRYYTMSERKPQEKIPAESREKG